MSTDFEGFGPQALDFLDGLAADNSKAYFDAHRDVYERQVSGPMRALVVDVGAQLADAVDPGIRAEPKVGRSLFRINRDLRFAADTTPYHPYVDAVFWEGESPRTSPGFILRVAADEVVVGAGVFRLDAPAVQRWRTAVAADRSGSELVEVIDGVRRSLRGAALSEPTRARVPREYPADHPRGELLRRDAIHLSLTTAPPAALTSRKLIPWLVDRYVRLAPFHRWLVEHVG